MPCHLTACTAWRGPCCRAIFHSLTCRGVIPVCFLQCNVVPSLELFFMGLFVFNIFHMYLAGATGYGIYTTIFSHFLNDDMQNYGRQLTLTRLDLAHFNFGEYVGNDFLHSMMLVAMKQVYGYVIWFALAIAAIFLLCDIPAIRTNIRKVPRWSVYAIEYLAGKK